MAEIDEKTRDGEYIEQHELGFARAQAQLDELRAVNSGGAP